MLFNFYLYILSNKHTFYDLNIDLTILEIVALPIKLKVYITKEPSPKEMTLSSNIYQSVAKLIITV